MTNKENLKNVVNTLIKSWKETRQLTYDFINENTLEIMNKELPRPGLNTLAKHILEMALVQKAYTRALEGQSLDFSEVEGITFGKEDYVASNKSELIKHLKDADDYFYTVVEKVENWDDKIEMFGEIVPKYAVLELLIRHETLHHGQFVAFVYILKAKFPESWIEFWALPIEEEKE